MSLSKAERMKKLNEIRDEDIDYSDVPELDNSFWENAVVEYPARKKPVTLRLDSDILAWFKSRGRGYQTRINAVLRSYVDANKKSAS